MFSQGNTGERLGATIPMGRSYEYPQEQDQLVYADQKQGPAEGHFCSGLRLVCRTS